MLEYTNLLRDVMRNGVLSEDRTGTGTLSVFGRQCRYNLEDGFPLVTTKKVEFSSISSELLWFLEGSTDERRLAEIRYGQPRVDLVDKRTIWTDNADHQGKDLGYENDQFTKELGPIYGAQWRYGFDFIDQVRVLVDGLKNNPYSRRHILSAWNVGDLDRMALVPCHILSQFYVREEKLSCQFYIRSNDLFLGAPYNIASYALLTHMLAQVCGLGVGDLIHTIGDAHIYTNHMDQCKEQIARDPRPLPKLVLNPSIKDIDKFSMEDISLEGYDPHPKIKAKMAI